MKLTRLRPSRLLACLLVTLSGLIGLAQEKVAHELAELSFNQDVVIIQPHRQYEVFHVKISGPDQFFDLYHFTGDEMPVLTKLDREGSPLPDGIYTFEIVAAPLVSDEMLAIIDEARVSNDREVLDALRTELPRGKVQSGTYRIVDGNIVVPFSEEFEAKTGVITSEPGYRPTDIDPGNNDRVISDDLITIGSACVGFDCVNGETFNSDTLRLKENILRIHFDDTSTGGSLPENDWRLIVNDESSGGAEYLAIEDSSGSTAPFRVDAGANDDALRISSDGDIGLGTATPVVELHLVDDETPTIRLEQDDTSSFTPQTWDLAGNEYDFSIKDVTNSNSQPFRIETGAADKALVIDDSGNIGQGTLTPSEALHIYGSDGDTALLIQETNTTAAQRNMLEILNQSGPVEIRLNAGSSPGDTADAWAIRINNNGSTLYFDALNDGSEEMDLDENGNLTVDGDVTATAFNVTSDRNLKEEFEVVNPFEVLEKVAAMPITTWEFNFDEADIRHMGPMAQDFHAAFGLGATDTKIGLTDSSGVALAAIQGLRLMHEQKDQTIRELRQRNDELQRRLERLEKAFEAMQ
jgi:hypothetical protein